VQGRAQPGDRQVELDRSLELGSGQSVLDLAAGLAGHGLSHAEVVEAGRAAASRMGRLLAAILPRV